MSDDIMQFVANLRELASKQDMTQESLAEATGIPRYTVANLFTGRRMYLRVDELVAFARAFGVHPALIDPRIDPSLAETVRRINDVRATLDRLEAAVKS